MLFVVVSRHHVSHVHFIDLFSVVGRHVLCCCVSASCYPCTCYRSFFLGRKTCYLLMCLSICFRQHKLTRFNDVSFHRNMKLTRYLHPAMLSDVIGCVIKALCKYIRIAQHSFYWAPGFTPDISMVRVARSLVLCVVFCRSLFLLLAIVMSLLLWCTDSDYPFGIFKLFLMM